jgi:hypothetical protein
MNIRRCFAATTNFEKSQIYNRVVRIIFGSLNNYKSLATKLDQIPRRYGWSGESARRGEIQENEEWALMLSIPALASTSMAYKIWTRSMEENVPIGPSPEVMSK